MRRARAWVVEVVAQTSFENARDIKRRAEGKTSWTRKKHSQVLFVVEQPRAALCSLFACYLLYPSASRESKKYIRFLGINMPTIVATAVFIYL